MANETRLIDYQKAREIVLNELKGKVTTVTAVMLSTKMKYATVDAVEVVRIEEVKQEILDGLDVLIAEYRHISQSSNDHFGIKADAMETARVLVNAALTDLCTNCGAKMDGGDEDG